MNAQIPLALRFAPDQLLSAFVGQAAISGAVASVARGDNPDWLYLAGPAGSGKTHLLLAACAEARGLGRDAGYVPLASVAGRLASMLEGLPVQALTCLDGVETIAGRTDDEVALFHFHNAVRQAGGQLLYAGNAMPAALGIALPDLVSRLGQCTRLALSPPDEDTRRAILRERASRRGLELDDAVLDYLFRRVGRDLVSLTGLLEALDRASLASQRRITVPLVKAVLEG